MRTRMPFIQPRLNGGSHFLEFPREKVVGALDDHESLRPGDRGEKRFDFFARPELVAAAMNEELRFRTCAKKSHVEAVHWNSEADQFRDARILAANPQAHPGSKTKSRKQNLTLRKFFAKVIERRADIVLFAAPVIVHTFAQTDAAEIKSENRNVAGVNRFGRAENHFVVKRAAEHWVRVAHDGDERWMRLRRGPKRGFDATRRT